MFVDIHEHGTGQDRTGQADRAPEVVESIKMCKYRQAHGET